MRAALSAGFLALLPFFFLSGVKAEPKGQAAEATSVSQEVPVSLGLRDCLDMAVRMNPELLQASTGFTDAEGRALQLRALLYPEIQAAVVSTPPTIYVRVEQVLYSRALDPSIKLSRLTHEEAELNYRQTLTAVMYEVRQAFSMALAQDQEIILLQRHLEFCQDAISRARQQFDAGKIQKAELARLEVQSNQARQRLLQAQSARNQTVLELSRILGQGIPTDVRFKGKLGEEPIPELSMARLTAEALLNRADYQALKTAKLRQSQQILLSTQALYPRVSAGTKSTIQPGGLGFAEDYDLNRNNDEPNIQRAGGNTQIPLSLYLSWRFFDGGHSAGLKQSGEAQLASQSEALDALGRSIPNEIREAMDALNNAVLTLEALKTSPDAGKLRQTYQLDFEAGKVRLLDQSLMEDSILAQEEKILQARLHFSLSAAALDRSLGRVVQFK